MSNRKDRSVSKLLSYALRHEPSSLNLTLDVKGFATVTDVIAGMQTRVPGFTVDDLDREVQTNSKKRFEYDTTGTCIRACQGHSVPVDLGLERLEPPLFLYHGTGRFACYSIGADLRIKRMQRSHVHLSDTIEKAKDVARRREGEPVILEVTAYEMHKAVFVFYRSGNGVWLTDHVPTKFILNFHRKKFY